MEEGKRGMGVIRRKKKEELKKLRWMMEKKSKEEREGPGTEEK